MKRLLMLALLTFTTASVALCGIPPTINYQGSLKEKGLPVTATKQMLFRITDVTGQQVYWTSPSIPVSVKNGLFSQPLTITGVNWETITPYLEVSVEGQMLLPREALSTTVYAEVSNSVVDGAVTPNKVASGYGLVPSGMIAMFDTACPAGWTRFSGLDNKFPMGNSVYGSTGGSATATHNHPISMDPGHIHRLATAGQSNYNCNGLPIGGAQGVFLFYPGTTTGSCTMDMVSPQTTGSGSHDHGGATANATVQTVPPYLSVLWCKKN